MARPRALTTASLLSGNQQLEGFPELIQFHMSRATNRPQELDEAARRRLQKKLYIPLPGPASRLELILNLIKSENHILTKSDVDDIVLKTDGYSGADLRALCTEAAFEALRGLSVDIAHVDAGGMRGFNRMDFDRGLKQVRASVSQGDIVQYLEWNKTFGSFSDDGKTDD
jgi:SpoVK/Ycf46/Vps4 family AAA+-type ATPase